MREGESGWISQPCIDSVPPPPCPPFPDLMPSSKLTFFCHYLLNPPCRLSLHPTTSFFSHFDSIRSCSEPPRPSSFGSILL
mmetsp:Transcript_21572/g.42876  ORF Transcript_21572/g.42876 Transcript_21572/m.42876 type:complete len:81 (+) Transcript_21572:399-641(+)